MFPSVTDEVAQTPWWWEDAPVQNLPHEKIAPECDVAIIGAGYTGLTAALTLAKAGKSVQVFDKFRPGEGASGRNGGITSGSLRFGLGEAIKAFGPERGVGLHREAIEARTHLRELIETNDISCDYTLSGLFTGALTDKDFEANKRAVEVHNATLGSEYKIVEKPELHNITSSKRFVGGVLRGDVGTIQPAKLVAGLLASAVKQGARVHSETPALDVSRSGAAHVIETPRGDCKAADVIVATNGYTDASNGWLNRRLVPVTSRIVVTEELSPNLISALSPGRHAMGETRKLFRYFRPTPDGKRMLLGSREPAWRRDPIRAIDHLRQGLTDIFPELDGTKITHSWAGNVAFSRDQLPSMFSKDGLHYAVGYCGSGTVWAPWLGYKTALKILGDPKSRSHFETEPPASVPFYNGKPWFIPAVLSGYAIHDWLRGRR